MAAVARMEWAGTPIDTSTLGRLRDHWNQIKAELVTLDMQAIDRDDLARALNAFDPIWDVLLTPEKERVLQLLVEQIHLEMPATDLPEDLRLADRRQRLHPEQREEQENERDRTKAPLEPQVHT